MPTKECPMCQGKTTYNTKLLGKHPATYGYHAHCPKCEASFSNSNITKDRVIGWDNVKSNIYPKTTECVDRLKNIIANSMNIGNRNRKEPSMCSENSEDALTWSVFNTLEEHNLLGKVYSYFTGCETAGDVEIYYWGYNDRYLNSQFIEEYMSVLKLAKEPSWGGGYSEPDILLFNPQHGIINIEVKYKSPNDHKLRNQNNNKKNIQKRLDRAQKMLDIGEKYVTFNQVKDWIWYELLRMWVPSCLVVERMNLKSFTLINLLPASMLEKEKGRVTKDMCLCVETNFLKTNKNLCFKQSTWEEFCNYTYDLQAINNSDFWQYIKRKGFQPSDIDLKEYSQNSWHLQNLLSNKSNRDVA